METIFAVLFMVSLLTVIFVPAIAKETSEEIMGINRIIGFVSSIILLGFGSGAYFFGATFSRGDKVRGWQFALFILLVIVSISQVFRSEFSHFGSTAMRRYGTAKIRTGKFFRRTWFNSHLGKFLNYVRYRLIIAFKR